MAKIGRAISKTGTLIQARVCARFRNRRVPSCWVEEQDMFWISCIYTDGMPRSVGLPFISEAFDVGIHSLHGLYRNTRRYAGADYTMSLPSHTSRFKSTYQHNFCLPLWLRLYSVMVEKRYGEILVRARSDRHIFGRFSPYQSRRFLFLCRVKSSGDLIIHSDSSPVIEAHLGHYLMSK